jgi:hypothetical protein
MSTSVIKNKTNLFMLRTAKVAGGSGCTYIRSPLGFKRLIHSPNVHLFCSFKRQCVNVVIMDRTYSATDNVLVTFEGREFVPFAEICVPHVNWNVGTSSDCS